MCRFASSTGALSKACSSAPARGAARQTPSATTAARIAHQARSAPRRPLVPGARGLARSLWESERVAVTAAGEATVVPEAPPRTKLARSAGALTRTAKTRSRSVTSVSQRGFGNEQQRAWPSWPGDTERTSLAGRHSPLGCRAPRLTSSSRSAPEARHSPPRSSPPTLGQKEMPTRNSGYQSSHSSTFSLQSSMCS